MQGLLQRFEMMYSMQRLTGVMSNFMQACANMGFSMDDTIDLKRMMKDTTQMDKALGKLDAMTDQMDMVFDTIDSGMRDGTEAIPSDEESDAEADEMLDRVMGRRNTVNYGPQATEAQATAASDSVAAEQSDDDDVQARLNRMMEELKD